MKNLEKLFLKQEQTSTFKALKLQNKQIPKQRLLLSFISYQLSENNKNNLDKITDNEKSTLLFEKYKQINLSHLRFLTEIQRCTEAEMTDLRSTNSAKFDRYIKTTKIAFKKKIVKLNSHFIILNSHFIILNSLLYLLN